MNTVQIGREFEKEALEILKDKFDKVIWLSKNKRTTFDFLGIRNDKKYYGEAKVNNCGNRISLQNNQKNADFVVVKLKGEVFFFEGTIPKRVHLKNIYGFMGNRNVKIPEEVWWELSKIKVNNKLKSISEVIKFLLKKFEGKK